MLYKTATKDPAKMKYKPPYKAKEKTATLMTLARPLDMGEVKSNAQMVCSNMSRAGDPRNGVIRVPVYGRCEDVQGSSAG